MSASVGRVSQSIRKSKKRLRNTKKSISMLKKDLDQGLLNERIKDAKSANKTNSQDAVRKLIGLTQLYGDVIKKLQLKIASQESQLEKVREEVTKQETSLLREVKKLHSLLSTKSNNSESSSYIYGQNEIGGNRDSPFSI